MTGQGQLVEFLDRLAVLGGVVSGLEAVVADPERILFRHAAGYLVGGERLIAGSGARFDAASLTKPWAATLAVTLGLDDPELDALLRHRGGLAAWMPLGARFGAKLGDRRELARALGELRPPGSAGAIAAPALYSDLGYVLWGLLVEERLNESWTALLDRRVCAELGLARLGEMAAAGGVTGAVECRLDNGREVELAAQQGLTLAPQRSFLRGIPQDGNARALLAAGHLPAHAGLFVTADEMLALGREWLTPGRLLSSGQIASALAGGGEYASGWARWSVDGSSGPALSPSSFGHTGFTGGSLWIDPPRSRVHVLVAHRLSSSIDFNPFRREFHRFAAEL